jgi:hypothetical protein
MKRKKNKFNYEGEFEKLFELLMEARVIFYVWKGLQDKKYEKIWSKNNIFWNAVTVSLWRTWNQCLANVYENSEYDIISIPVLARKQEDLSKKQEIEKILKDDKRLLNLISVIRKNVLAHNNVDFKFKYKKIFKNLNLKYKDFEELFDKTEKLLHLLNPDNSKNHWYVLEGLDEKAKSESKGVMKKIIYYHKKEKEHQDECLRKNEWKPFED